MLVITLSPSLFGLLLPRKQTAGHQKGESPLTNPWIFTFMIGSPKQNGPKPERKKRTDFLDLLKMLAKNKGKTYWWFNGGASHGTIRKENQDLSRLGRKIRGPQTPFGFFMLRQGFWRFLAEKPFEAWTRAQIFFFEKDQKKRTGTPNNQV